MGNKVDRSVRADLGARLRERLPELQAAVATRVYSISDPMEVTDPGYLKGLNEATAAAIEYRLGVLEEGERQAPEVPTALLAQARLDARDGVPLDTVLRRYFAGNALFGDFLVEEAERAEVASADLRPLLAAQATFVDRLIAAVSEEHGREARNRPRSAAERRRQTVKALLAGELVDYTDLGYDLDACHLALIANGQGAEELMRGVAAALDRRLLAVKREEEPILACWLGGTRPIAAEEAAATVADAAPERVFVAVGEPGEGLAGWRFSHQQAKAALPIAERRGEAALRYADVAVLASIARDNLLATSLRRLYLEPLEGTRDGGKVARETLRAYFEAERNISSTAAALGVDRRTVRNRLRGIEELLGGPLTGSLVDLEIALRLDN
jgi:hypothetical protein